MTRQDVRVDSVCDERVVVVLEALDDVGEGPVGVDHCERPQSLGTDQSHGDCTLAESLVLGKSCPPDVR